MRHVTPMSHIFPLFRDVPTQEVQVDISTNGRGVQNVIECSLCPKAISTVPFLVKVLVYWS